MIGHYLLTLTPEQEDRVLTQQMKPGFFGLCLTATVLGPAEAGASSWRPCNRRWPIALREWEALPSPKHQSIEIRFDSLCARFGEPRVNDAIRARIVENRARRILQPACLVEAV